MTALLTWLAASVAVHHWQLCLGVFCTFVLACQIVAGIFVVVWAGRLHPTDEGRK